MKANKALDKHDPFKSSLNTGGSQSDHDKFLKNHKERVRTKHYGKSHTPKGERGEKMKDFYNNLMK